MYLLVPKYCRKHARSVVTTLLAIVLVSSSVRDAFGINHPPSSPHERAFVVQQNDFGTTSVGLKVSSLLIYYEHSGHAPQPAPGWFRIAHARGITISSAVFNIDGVKLRAGGSSLALGLTNEELRSLVRAKVLSVELQWYNNRGKEIVEFRESDFVNLRDLLAYGEEWKAPVNPTDELRGVIHVINLAGLSAKQLGNVREQLKSNLKLNEDKNAFFLLYAYADRRMIFPERGSIRTSPDAVSLAQRFLDSLNSVSIPVKETLDLTDAIGYSSPTLVVHTTSHLRIDDEGRALSLLRNDTLRIHFVVYESPEPLTATEKRAIEIMERLASATGGRVVKAN